MLDAELTAQLLILILAPAVPFSLTGRPPSHPIMKTHSGPMQPTQREPHSQQHCSHDKRQTCQTCQTYQTCQTRRPLGVAKARLHRAHRNATRCSVSAAERLPQRIDLKGQTQQSPKASLIQDWRSDAQTSSSLSSIHMQSRKIQLRIWPCPARCNEATL
jgi:hypothetical protein